MNKLKKSVIIMFAIIFFCHGPIGGFLCQTVVSVASYVGICVGSIFSKDLRDDMSAIGYNPFNVSEQKVLNSEKVSFYKGVPIYRMNGDFRSGSFCAILFAKGDSAEDLKHESGHNVQQLLLGPITFLAIIGAPSFFEFSTREYYDRPWEITADLFGGVTSRSHSQADIAKGRGFIATSFLTGPIGYFFLIGEY